MTQYKDTMINQLVEELDKNQEGSIMPNLVTILINLAMKIEQEKALSAEPYERNTERLGQRNGYKDKSLDTRLGKLNLQVPQVRGDIKFYPTSIEKGCRSERALKLAIAQMYVLGVSTRKVTKVVEKLCGLSVSQAQVTDASKLLDEEIKIWRNRPLGRFEYLIMDATYENVRLANAVVKGAVLVAFGIDYEGNRTVIGVSTEISEAEVHWRNFFLSLVKRGFHGLRMIVSDDHAGMKAAREAVFPGIPWQRCQFHIQMNARHHTSKKSLYKEVANDIRTIFNAPNFEDAKMYLNKYVEKYEKLDKDLANWMDTNIPESLTVFSIPENHRKKLRTSNMAERQMREIKRRTRVASIFPNKESANRLISAILMETDETWKTGRRYLPEA